VKSTVLGTLLLVLGLVGLVACGTTAATPRVPAADPMLVPVAESMPDVDFDGTADAVEALEKSLEGDRRNPWHRFVLSGSAMFAMNFDTRIRVDSKELGEGAELSLEDLLGLDDQASLFRIDANYRFNRHQMLGFSWFDIDRTGEQKIQEDLDIGDETFPAGADVRTGLDTEIFKLNYWWNFVAEEDWELGVGLGVYWMRIDASFDGRLVAGEEEFDESVRETVKVDLPPPLLGLRGAYAITRRLRATGSFEILYVPIDAFRGWIVDARLGLEWDILDFAGLGLGYNFFNMGVDVDKDGFEGTFDYRYHALLGSIYFYL